MRGFFNILLTALAVVVGYAVVSRCVEETREFR